MDCQVGPWHHLKIEPTTDKKAIKRAYAIQLRHANPEEHPEAFQKLRDAFEWALAWAELQTEAPPFQPFLHEKAPPENIGNPAEHDVGVPDPCLPDKPATDTAKRIFKDFCRMWEAGDQEATIAFVEGLHEGEELWQDPSTLDRLNHDIFQYLEDKDVWPSKLIECLYENFYWDMRLERLQWVLGSARLHAFGHRTFEALHRPKYKIMEEAWATFVETDRIIAPQTNLNLFSKAIDSILEAEPNFEPEIVRFLFRMIATADLSSETLVILSEAYNLELAARELQPQDQRSDVFHLAISKINFAYSQSHLFPKDWLHRGSVGSEEEDTQYNSQMLFFVIIGGIVIMIAIALFSDYHDVSDSIPFPEQPPARTSTLPRAPNLTKEADPRTTLALLLSAGDPQMIEDLLKKHQIDLDRGLTEHGQPPLFDLIAAGETIKAEVLLKHGANPNISMEETGTTPLLSAVNQSHVAITQLLLAYEANPNQTNLAGQTPLHRASILNQDQIARILMEHGANPDIKSSTSSKSPRELAQERGHDKILEFMKDQPAIE